VVPPEEVVVPPEEAVVPPEEAVVPPDEVVAPDPPDEVVAPDPPDEVVAPDPPDEVVAPDPPVPEPPPPPGFLPALPSWEASGAPPLLSPLQAARIVDSAAARTLHVFLLMTPLVPGTVARTREGIQS
jgi:hypothetical protein